MNKIYNDIVERTAKKLREKIHDGVFFGESIDETNEDEMLVAVYWLGRNEEKDFQEFSKGLIEP
jgi:hypothetical protein